MTQFEPKNYKHLIGEGVNSKIGQISNDSFLIHLKLYEGYVNNLNSLIEKLNLLDMYTPEYNELHRRFGWEWNGMRLHELYFDSLGLVPSSEIDSKFVEAISSNFPNYESWLKDFFSICKIRGIGWAMLVQDKVSRKLFNTWVNEHDQGMLADVDIILNIDMFEHAYMIDFGTDREKYVNSVFGNLDWGIISSRLQ